MIGRFNPNVDLLLAQFDCKTDVDDLHSAAALMTVLNKPRFSDIHYHVVAGTYGTQGGLYVPGEALFEHCFGDHWSDAHANFEQALNEVFDIVKPVLNNSGTVWIPEAGQSNFSAALVRKIQGEMTHINTKDRVYIVQHSDWNEEVTAPADLSFVKENTHYIKIPDGNAVGNGSPGFRSEQQIDWQSHISEPHLNKAWTLAISLGHAYNGVEGRYENGAVTSGGLDFSDHAEVAYILGMEDLKDATEFFERLGQ